MEARFDENEIRAAERTLAAALEAADPTAWVTMYTDDALFVGPGSPAVEGREALLKMARASNPLSSVALTPIKTEGDGRLACVYGREAWVNGRPPNGGSESKVRFMIVWRKETDGQWQVAQELMNADV